MPSWPSIASFQCEPSLQANFAALMSKAKANTQQVSGAALARQAELEAQRKREVELEKQNAAREKERRLKEQEARQRREQERLELEERLRLERERKRAQKVGRVSNYCIPDFITKQAELLPPWPYRSRRMNSQRLLHKWRQRKKEEAYLRPRNAFHQLQGPVVRALAVLFSRRSVV